MNKAVKNTISGILSTPMLFDRRCAMQVISQFKTKYGILFGNSEGGSAALDAELSKAFEFKFSVVNGAKSETRTFTGQIDDDFKNIERGSVAVVPINGIMMRDDYCSMSEGFISGTRTIEALIDQLEASDSIGAVVFQINTPGGQASGNESLARKISSMKKPKIGHFEMMASAGVFAFQGLDKLYGNESQSSWGSIGTMVSWQDDRKFWLEQGVEFFDVYSRLSSEKNIDFRMADDGDYSALQDSLDSMTKAFIGQVKKVRPSIVDDGKVFKGKIYNAKEAKKIGAIDGVQSLDWVINKAKQLAKSSNNNSSSKQKNNTMGVLDPFMRAFGMLDETEKQEAKSEILAINSKVNAMEQSNATLTNQNAELIVSNTQLKADLAAKSALAEESTTNLEKVANSLKEAKEQLAVAEAQKAEMQTKLDAAIAHAKDLASLDTQANATPVDSQQSGITEPIQDQSTKDRYAATMAALGLKTSNL